MNCWLNVILCLFLCVNFLSGCGSLTGIPGHGGGKRFAIEQELVAAATRATIKQIDLTVIKGKRVNLFVNTIGDDGGGNLVGGRFSVISQLRGDYIQSPAVKEYSRYPTYSSITNSNSSGLRSTSTTQSTLNSPEYKRSQQKGYGKEFSIGVEYKGLGSYHNSEEIPSDDLRYLSGLLETYLFLQGVHIVPPSDAEVDVYVTVDVFGTVRTRVDWYFANNEILRSKTAVEVMAVDHLTGELLMRPQAAATEAEYNEQFILWAGPVSIKKFLKVSDPLLCDFTDLPSEVNDQNNWKVINGDIDYPFEYEIENRNKDSGMKNDAEEN